MTACRRSGLASVTTSRAPSDMASAMRASSTCAASNSTGTVGASWSRTRMADCSSSRLSATCTSSSGLSCVRASPRSRERRNPGAVRRLSGAPQDAVDSLDRLARGTQHDERNGVLLGQEALRWALAMAADSSTGAAAACVRDLAESAAAAGRLAGVGRCRYHTRPLWAGRAHPQPVSARTAMASYTTSEIRGGSQSPARRRSVHRDRERVRQAGQGPGVQPHQGAQPQDRAHHRAHLQVG